MQTFKSLLSNIIDEVAKKFNINKEQLGQIADRSISKDVGADVGTVLQDTLAKIVKPQIIKGLDVSATVPPSMKVNISPGYGSAQGKTCEILTAQQVEIQNLYGIYYIIIEGSRIKVNTAYTTGLALAKIVIPEPGVTNKILDDKNTDSDLDGYIISGKDLLFNNDFIIDDESLGQLKNVMSKIFAEYIFGTLRLSESLKIENTQGTMSADSQSIKFFNTNGDELAYYGGDEARVGNIKITPTTIQSRDYQQGAHGFRMKDDGDTEFGNIEARGTIHASAGSIDGDLTVGGSLSSPNFTSGYSGVGWKIAGDGTATFQNGLFRGELHTSVFVKDEIHATNGTFVVTNATVLASGTDSADTTIYVKDPVFSTNDIVRLKPDSTRSEYMLISGTGATTNIYNVVRNLDGTGANNFEAGDAIVSQQSRIDLVASGDVAAYLPYIDIIKRNSGNWSDTTTKARLGNLAGITDGNFGTLSDYGLYTNNGYFTGLLKASNFSAGTISGTNIAGVNIYGGNITGGTISGTTITGLNLNGQTITGVTLTSPTIQTATSGARVELDYTGLTVYNASNATVFDAIISGTTSGDVVIGDLSGSYMQWDNSLSKISFNVSSGTNSAITIQGAANSYPVLTLKNSTLYWNDGVSITRGMQYIDTIAGEVVSQTINGYSYRMYSSGVLYLQAPNANVQCLSELTVPTNTYLKFGNSGIKESAGNELSLYKGTVQKLMIDDDVTIMGGGDLRITQSGTTTDQFYYTIHHDDNYGLRIHENLNPGYGLIISGTGGIVFKSKAIFHHDTIPHTLASFKNNDTYPGTNTPLLVENYNTGYGAIFRNYCNDPIGGTGAGALFVVQGDNISNALYVVTQSATAIQYGLQLDHNSVAGAGICLHNIVDGTGFQLINWGDAGLGMSIQNVRPDRVSPYPHKGLNVYNLISTGGYGIQVTNNYSGTGGSGIEVWNGDHGQGETVGIYVNNAGANYGVKIDHWNGDGGLYVTNQSVTPGIYSLTYSGTAMQAQAVGASTLAFKAHGQGGTYGDMGLFTYGDGRCYAYANSSDPSLTIGQWGAGLDIIGSSSNWYVAAGGNLWLAGNCSALSFTDRTPHFEGDALVELSKIKGTAGDINHETLPLFARKIVKNEKTNKDEEARDLGAMISILVKGVQQLTEEIDTLKQQVKDLMEKPK